MYVCTSMQMKLNATPTPHKRSVIVVHGNVYVHTQEKKIVRGLVENQVEINFSIL